MSYFPNAFSPTPKFILESLELLLARLGQLSHHVRDTVSRIIGSTVAEAVSDALQRAMRRLPGRRSAGWRDPSWPNEVDPYDPFVDDAVIAERAYLLSRAVPTNSADWCAPWQSLIAFLTTYCQRIWYWAVAHHWRISIAVVVGLIALFAARYQSDA